ncbi:hypothetical protein AB4K20DRAFT_1981336 [Rhizopus microsporus]|uniref:Uncharacterized protein n=1 Tax=Rhizopus microsporus TaxID=58291 RepID=A0A1X0S6V3_RHIZD|nr:hypothetical protein BCV71DRAFT_233618 [Rhizopus microsporus]
MTKSLKKPTKPINRTDLVFVKSLDPNISDVVSKRPAFKIAFSQRNYPLYDQRRRKLVLANLCYTGAPLPATINLCVMILQEHSDSTFMNIIVNYLFPSRDRNVLKVVLRHLSSDALHTAPGCK